MSSDLLKDFEVVIEIPTRWGDMDAMKHINNTLFFRYFESARMEYVRRIKVYNELRERGEGPILAFTSCAFKAPLVHPDIILVGARIREIKKHSFTFDFLLLSKKLEKPAATGEAVMVWYDYEKGEKLTIPDILIEEFKKIDENIIFR